MDLSSLPNRPLTRQELIDILRVNFVFPGEFPITVIARSGSEFYALLHSTLERLQGESTFTIIERPSSRKNFAAYRVEIYVESAETALYRKEIVGKIDGVLMMI